ncbi:hypothetical protein MTR67_048904 [Solanum verrucosum]|uniref:MULE transposase domain-containing protein n=1 Tax=Solanum verrucosum TaxID=315347 RepID=A0AAF1A0J5_SOLVR|nr:hypothetical protein MTR67_048904 [Solanum verrucosum]
MHTNNFSILIQHNGRWDSAGNYVDYNIEGVMYDPTAKYEGLLTAIASQLGVDTTIYHLELRYFDRIQSKRQSTSGVLGAMLVEKYVDLKTVYTPTDIQADMLRIHALDASIRGWEYCRPIVVVDGIHLKSTYEGTMLIASTLDPRGHILPLAYGIVDSENDDSWLWLPVVPLLEFVRKTIEAWNEKHNEEGTRINCNTPYSKQTKMQILRSCRCNLQSPSTDRRSDHGPCWWSVVHHATPPQTSSEKLAKSRLTDRPTVCRLDHGPCSVSVDRDFPYQPLIQTTVDQHGPSFDPRSVGEDQQPVS